MHLSEKIRSDIAVLSLKGSLLDEQDDERLKEKIDSLTSDNIKKVVLDMKLVNRVNSRGLSTLLSVVEIMQKHGGDLRLAAIDKHIFDILTITNLVRFFHTYETVDRAMASFS